MVGRLLRSWSRLRYNRVVGRDWRYLFFRVAKDQKTHTRLSWTSRIAQLSAVVATAGLRLPGYQRSANQDFTRSLNEDRPLPVAFAIVGWLEVTLR